MRCILFALALAGCFRTPSPRYYGAPIVGVRDSTTVPVVVRLDEKLLIEGNARLFLGRRENLEQAACYRIARARGDTLWLDSTLSAGIDRTRTTAIQISFTCSDGTVPVHWHVTYARDGWLQCEPSPADVSPWLAAFPAELIQCGFGADSIVAFKVRPRKPKQVDR